MHVHVYEFYLANDSHKCTNKWLAIVHFTQCCKQTKNRSR